MLVILFYVENLNYTITCYIKYLFIIIKESLANTLNFTFYRRAHVHTHTPHIYNVLILNVDIIVIELLLN